MRWRYCPEPKEEMIKVKAYILQEKRLIGIF
jgi:hypothetical protein